ncbi:MULTISPECIES: hypothetical protein [Clostridium]|uniref:hypothetical protein n=1 Tax=Clostridium TaxID=1485 RepID=UPI00189A8BB1|nr:MULTISPECIES: hypothetical protein [Clostridium]MCR1949659.1 hypothetical protein [Clostridium sp. DSM 100503]MDI9216207.1 hypothetical protein [Clostridium tertium]
MIKKNSKTLSKFITIFIISLIVSFSLGEIISNFKGYNFRDVLFVEGIIILMMGIFSAVGGNPMSLSLQDFGRINPQWLANISLETNEIDRRRIIDSCKVNINIDITTVSLVIGGLISSLISSIL